LTRSQIIVLSGVATTIALIGLLSLGFFAVNHGLITLDEKKPDLVFHTKNGQAVHDFFARFAKSEGYSFTDSTPLTPPEDGHPAFSLEMDQGDKVMKVLSGTRAGSFFVFVDAKKSDAALKAMEMRLLTQLRSEWPDAAEYKGP
jgi:hypothetical protein